MVIFRATSASELQQQLKEAATIISRGGVVVVPTDTSYGLAADATNVAAVERVRAIKDRTPVKYFHVIVSDLQMAERYVELGSYGAALCQTFMPGPVTFIFPERADSGLAANLLPADLGEMAREIGVRIPGHEIPLELARLAGVALTATSANMSGEPDLYDAADIARVFQERAADGRVVPDALIDAGALAHVLPSTMVRVTSDATSPLELVRQGPIPYDAILSFVQHFHI